jgi:general secretion pathway protein J
VIVRAHPVRPVESAAGFSLFELLVAIAVFAALAAAAYAGLAEIARARGALAAHQDRFASAVRAVSTLERDLQQAASRPVRGNGRGETLPALAGASDRIELTRLGFANPRAEARSNLERVAYATNDGKLQRARYGVLDRAPDTTPAPSALLDQVGALALRYLGTDGIWRDAWPPAELANGTPGQSMAEVLPRAVEFRIDATGIGELRRIVELPSSIPPLAADRAQAPGGGDRPQPPPPPTRGEGATP